MSTPLFHRVAEQDRRPVPFTLDGRPAEGLEGDTVMTAMLTNGARLRTSEFGHGPRAGFCVMGACQDCWVRTEDGERLRACSTVLTEGMRLVSGEGAP